MTQMCNNTVKNNFKTILIFRTYMLQPALTYFFLFDASIEMVEYGKHV